MSISHTRFAARAQRHDMLPLRGHHQLLGPVDTHHSPLARDGLCFVQGICCVEIRVVSAPDNAAWNKIRRAARGCAKIVQVCGT